MSNETNQDLPKLPTLNALSKIVREVQAEQQNPGPEKMPLTVWNLRKAIADYIVMLSETHPYEHVFDGMAIQLRNLDRVLDFVVQTESEKYIVSGEVRLMEYLRATVQLDGIAIRVENRTKFEHDDRLQHIDRLVNEYRKLAYERAERNIKAYRDRKLISFLGEENEYGTVIEPRMVVEHRLAVAKNDDILKWFVGSLATKEGREMLCNPTFDDTVYEPHDINFVLEMLDGWGWKLVDYHEGRYLFACELIGLTLSVFEKQSDKFDYKIIDQLEFERLDVSL